MQWVIDLWNKGKEVVGGIGSWIKEAGGKVVGIVTGQTAENGEKWLKQMTGAGKTAITLGIIALVAIVIMYIFWVYKNKAKRKAYEETVKEKNRVEDIVHRQQMKSIAVPDKIFFPPPNIHQNGFGTPPQQVANTAIEFGKQNK